MAKLVCPECGESHIPLYPCPKRKAPHTVAARQPAEPKLRHPAAKAQSGWMWLVEIGLAEMDRRKVEARAANRDRVRRHRANKSKP